MNEKRHYEAPSIEVLSIGTRNSLLAGSTDSGSVLETDSDSDSFNEDANLNSFDNGWE